MNGREARSAVFWMLFGVAIVFGVFFGLPLLLAAVEWLKGDLSVNNLLETIRSWTAEDWISFTIIGGGFLIAVVCEVIGVVKAS